MKTNDTQPILLVVDDEESAQLLFRLEFRKQPFQLVFAKNMNEAVEILKQEDVAMVISDIRMESQDDGIQLLKFIKGTTSFCHIPVVIMTAYGNQQVSAMENGADAFFVKSLNFGDLIMKVRMLIEQPKTMGDTWWKRIS